MRSLLVPLALCFALTLASCGSSLNAADDPLTAEQVARALAIEIPQSEPSKVYDERNDPDELLGKPNGYESKVAYTDNRVPKVKAQKLEEGDVRLGGRIEVFGRAEQAGRRADYLSALQSKSPEPIGSEYLYVSGPAVLRVSGLLTPAQAREYAAALGEALNSEVTSANRTTE